MHITFHGRRSESEKCIPLWLNFNKQKYFNFIVNTACVSLELIKQIPVPKNYTMNNRNENHAKIIMLF